MKFNKGAGFHVILITLLVLVFFGILFVTSMNVDVEIIPDFKDEIKLTNLPDYNSNFIVGEIIVNNNGYFPSKVFLDEYVICQISDTFGTRTFQLNYKGKVNTEYADVFKSYSQSEKYIEISGGDTAKLDVSPNFSYDLKSDIKKYNLNGQKLPFYLFKVDKDYNSRNYYSYSYNYCNSANKEDAIKVIYLDIQIPQNLIDDVKIY
ncbi:MAG: hypothetical protein KC589_10700 [Nanoarchaeota archaeon]|nr:hypothetical protein [Nanoarchaeota archaeon]